MVTPSAAKLFHGRILHAVTGNINRFHKSLVLPIQLETRITASGSTAKTTSDNYYQKVPLRTASILQSIKPTGKRPTRSPKSGSTMAPATVTLDVTSDFDKTSPAKRTLLLAPPSLAAASTTLATIVSQYDRSTTDLQMLDRLSAGLVNLPASTYDLILVLADASSSLTTSLSLLDRKVLGSTVESIRPSGRLEVQDATDLEHAQIKREAVLAGLVASGNGFEKPDYGEGEGMVSLKLGSRKKKSDAGPAVTKVDVNVNGHTTKLDMKPSVPAGVGFVDLDDFSGDDDDLIDEETLMTEDDLKRPLNVRELHLLPRLS